MFTLEKIEAVLNLPDEQKQEKLEQIGVALLHSAVTQGPDGAELAQRLLEEQQVKNGLKFSDTSPMILFSAAQCQNHGIAYLLAKELVGIWKWTGKLQQYIFNYPKTVNSIEAGARSAGDTEFLGRFNALKPSDRQVIMPAYQGRAQPTGSATGEVDGNSNQRNNLEAAETGSIPCSQRMPLYNGGREVTQEHNVANHPRQKQRMN